MGGRRKQLIRINFREQVFTRDGWKCKFCDIVDGLDAHHITDRTEMPNGGYVPENGITLCAEHHMQAERFHSSGGSEWEDGRSVPNSILLFLIQLL